MSSSAQDDPGVRSGRNEGQPAWAVPVRTDTEWALPGDPDPPALSLQIPGEDSQALSGPPAPPCPLRRAWRACRSGVSWLFGAATLVGILATLAAIPLAGFLSLGYLLEAGGRVARTGRLRDGFPGVRAAVPIGTMILGTWLVLLPLRYLSSWLLSAEIIDPSGPGNATARLGLVALGLLAWVQIVLSVLRGGRLRSFLWPVGNLLWAVRQVRQGRAYARARDACWAFLAGLRLPYYFWLGVRGFAGAALWLFVPITLLAVGRQVPALGLLGGILFAVALLYVPFLQIRFARERRFRVYLQPGEVRRGFARAPWAFALALFLALLLALPLYLLKIEMVPKEAGPLVGLFFIVFIFPARLITGWAYGYSVRRQASRHWLLRWSARPVMLATVAAYVILVVITQYTSWHGLNSLYEQHAFLLPAPVVSP